MATDDKEKNRIGLLLAVIAGLLALGMTFVFLKKMKDQSATEAVKHPALDYKRVVAARRDLPSGHILNVNNDLQELVLPLTEATEKFANNCVVVERAIELEGRKIGTAVPAQYPLLYSNLLPVQSLDDTFTEGFLKTITLAKENFFSSHLIPGDRVDILVTLPKNKPTAVATGGSSPTDMMALAMQPLLALANEQNQEMETITLLENAEIFMVGAMLKGNRQQLVGLVSNEETNEVTFRLSKKDAVLLTQYVNSGARISLLLRPRLKN